MEKRDILARLKEKGIILFDGAMGTMLYAHGIYVNRCFEELNLSQPKLVKEIHQAYIKAGVDCLETNTFGANKYRLEAHGFYEKLFDINFQGARLAREVAGDEVLVAGSMGPLGSAIEPWGRISEEAARAAFKEQAEALLKGGVDLFILETFTNLKEIILALQVIKELGPLPVITQMTIGSDGNTLFGTPPEVFTAELDSQGADIIGLNCSLGPPAMLEVLEKMVKVTNKPISIQPNAGNPVVVDGRNFYMASSEYMAEYARRFIMAGARIVGGCCGTTPEYIKAISRAIRSIVPKKRELSISIQQTAHEEIKTIPLADKSRFSSKLAKQDFVTSVEIVPPRGCDVEKIMLAVRKLKERGVDAVNIPDGPRALARMSAQHISFLIEQKVGLETVLHYACRDRNLLGMMSDFLGMHAVGLRNVLIITGDPPKMGDYPDATAVFDVDSIGLTKMVATLNRGYDLGGNPIGQPTSYLIGVGVNPGALDTELEIRRFKQKIAAGAEFAITQPVFDSSILINFLNRIKQEVSIPVIAGVWPLISLRNAEFMNNEVPGASVPEKIMERMRRTAEVSKERALQEGLQIAREAIAEIKSHVQGVQVSAPLGNVDYALEVLSVLQ